MKRGQAALEYLVTYGWAFIAILVVIGALAYFGFLSPSKYLPARCDFGAQLICIDYALVDNDENGCVLLQFQNNFGVDIQIHDVILSDHTGELDYGPNPDCDGGESAIDPIVQGNVSMIFSLNIPVDNDVLLLEGERSSVRMRVVYSRDLVGAPKHNVTGEIFASASTI